MLTLALERHADPPWTAPARRPQRAGCGNRRTQGEEHAKPRNQMSGVPARSLGGVAPQAYPCDPERRARFERQYAQLLWARAEAAAACPPAAESAAAHAFAALTARRAPLRFELKRTEHLSTLRRAACQAAGVEDCPRALARLHVGWAGFERASACAEDKAAALAPLARDGRFRAAYERMVCEDVLPAMLKELGGSGSEGSERHPESCETARRLPGGDRAFFQAVPCVRVQQPCDWHTIRPHFDAQYGHVDTTLNFYLPLSEGTFGSAALQLESTEGAEDFAPLALRHGEAAMFHGARLAHFTVANAEDVSRYTLDFRVVWGALHVPAEHGGDGEKSGRGEPYKVGAYFSEARREAKSGKWHIVTRGVPSRQHGFPFGSGGEGLGTRKE